MTSRASARACVKRTSVRDLFGMIVMSSIMCMERPMCGDTLSSRAQDRCMLPLGADNSAH